MRFLDKYDIHYEIHKLKEKLIMKIVWALPKYLVYWCVIRVWAYASTGKYHNLGPTEVQVDQALKAWRGPTIQFSIARKKLTLEQLDKIANYEDDGYEYKITEKVVQIGFWSNIDNFEPFFEYVGVPMKKFSKKSG